MRKSLCIFIISAFILFCLGGCSSASNMKINAYEWKLARVMAIEKETATVIASSDDSEISGTTKKIDITLIAENGSITITDHIHNCTYSGTYKRTQATPAGTDYKVTIDGTEGYATVAMTTYADGSQIPTLPISLGGYSLQLYAI